MDAAPPTIQQSPMKFAYLRDLTLLQLSIRLDQHETLKQKVGAHIFIFVI